MYTQLIALTLTDHWNVFHFLEEQFVIFKKIECEVNFNENMEVPFTFPLSDLTHNTRYE